MPFGGSKSGGEHFKISAALVHFDHGAVMFVQAVFESTSSTTNGTSFSKPEVALAIHLQIKRKVMERRRGVDKIAEVVVEVGFAVVVEVDQARDLVFAVHENLAVTNRQAQGLKKTRGEPFHRISFISRRPVTSQTSPFHVHTAAVLSSTKSNPPMRMYEFHGFSKGTGMSSTTKVSLPRSDVGFDDDLFGINRREQGRIRLASSEHPSEQTLRGGSGCKTLGLICSRVAAIPIMIEPEGSSTVGSMFITKDFPEISKRGAGAATDGKSRVTDPCSSSIRKNLDALSPGGVGHAELHAFGFRGGKDFQGTHQHIAALGLLDSVVFQHSGFSNGVVQDALVTHSHQSAPPSHFRRKGPQGLLGRGIFPDHSPSILDLPSFRRWACQPLQDGRRGFRYAETPSQSKPPCHRTNTQRPVSKDATHPFLEEQVEAFVGGCVVHGVARRTRDERAVVHSVPPFFFRNVLGGESGIETLGSGHVLRVKVAGFDEFVFDHALGIMGLDGKGAGRESLSPLADPSAPTSQ